MTSLINKIELLIKREKTTPERKKDEQSKSSSEILSELFGAFNADPPKIEEVPSKKSKKSKKKHKKEKKKRSRSSSSSSSDDSEYSHKRKKRKKSKSKRSRRSRSSIRTPSLTRSLTPALDIKVLPAPVKIKRQSEIKTEDVKVKPDPVKSEPVKTEPKEECKRQVNIKSEDKKNITISVSNVDTTSIPMPDSPAKDSQDSTDVRSKVDGKKSESDADKNNGKIKIKNLKFSAVFEETVKKAEEEARRRAEKYEEGEYTDSSAESVKEVVVNSQFPKTSDPGGLKKAAEECKQPEEEKSHKRSKKSESSHKSSKRDRSRSKRSHSRSRRSKSRSPKRRRHRSRSKTRRSRSRHRSSSRRKKSSSRAYSRRHSSDRRSDRHRTRRSRSPSGVKLADSEKKRLLEVARRNAINMLKNGAVPAGAAALPPHTRNQVMAAIQSGGKSVDELTDFCKNLSKKEALGELSSVSSHDGEMSENEDTIAFHHPFLVKEKAPIIMNIRGGVPLPVKTSLVPIANKEELRLQFPVSSGSQHREKASEWRPVSPPKKDMQVAKLNGSKQHTTNPMKALECGSRSTSAQSSSSALAPLSPDEFSSQDSQASSLLALPASPLSVPGPQAYPPGANSSKIDVAKIVSDKLLMIRKEQEQNEITTSTSGFGWTKESSTLGQFTGSTGAQILTPRELSSGVQAWAKRDQLTRAAPVEGGMGMHLLQKMGWTPGRGLGKEGTGTLQPLLLEVKLDTKGLQAKEEMKPPRGRMGRGGGGGGGGVTLLAGGKHPVSLLGEYCSKHKLGPPEYNLCFECGPDHKKNFLFKVKVAGIEYQPAVASQNKKQAKADAAQIALQKLGILP